MKQIDFITAFERVRAGHEQGFGLVCKLKQGLYDLKQAGKIWYDSLSSVLLCTTDYCVLRELGLIPRQWDGGLWYHKEKQGL